MNLSGISTVLALLLGSGSSAPGPSASDALGVAAFAGVYVLLLIWLCFLPARLLGEPADRPWWQSSRLWAIGICTLQILVYLGFG